MLMLVARGADRGRLPHGRRLVARRCGVRSACASAPQPGRWWWRSPGALALVVFFTGQSLPLRHHSEFGGSFDLSQRIAADRRRPAGRVPVAALARLLPVRAVAVRRGALARAEPDLRAPAVRPRAGRRLPRAVPARASRASPSSWSGTARTPPGVPGVRLEPVDGCRPRLSYWEETLDRRPSKATTVPGRFRRLPGGDVTARDDRPACANGRWALRGEGREYLRQVRRLRREDETSLRSFAAGLRYPLVHGQPIWIGRRTVLDGRERIEVADGGSLRVGLGDFGLTSSRRHVGDPGAAGAPASGATVSSPCSGGSAIVVDGGELVIGHGTNLNGLSKVLVAESVRIGAGLHAVLGLPDPRPRLPRHHRRRGRTTLGGTGACSGTASGSGTGAIILKGVTVGVGRRDRRRRGRHPRRRAAHRRRRLTGAGTRPGRQLALTCGRAVRRTGVPSRERVASVCALVKS